MKKRKAGRENKGEKFEDVGSGERESAGAMGNYEKWMKLRKEVQFAGEEPLDEVAQSGRADSLREWDERVRLKGWLGMKGADAENGLNNKGELPQKYFEGLNSEYVADKFEKNVELLKEVGDRRLLRVYENLMEEYPQLRMVELSDEEYGKGNACFRNSNEKPEVVLNISHGEVYKLNVFETLKNETAYDDRLGRKCLIKRLAFATGVDWRKCAKDKHFNVAATMLHEFGHAYDFIENYMKPEYEERKKVLGSGLGDLLEQMELTILSDARGKFIDDREEYEKRSPEAGFGFIDRKSKKWKRFEPRMKAMGIENYEEYLYARHQYYRDQPDEALADKFAYDYFERHFSEYFTTEEIKSGIDRRFQIEPNKEIKLDRDFVHILGLKQGLGVEISRVGSEEEKITGFLASNVYAGKSVYLYENGDPKNPGKKWKVGAGVSEIKLKPVRDEENGGIRQYVILQDNDGLEYNISCTGAETEMVEGTWEEMAVDLGLSEGDKVQLLEHLTQTEEDGLYMQHLRDATDGRDDIYEYHEVNDSSEFEETPARKWKTWWLGNYEVLPFVEEG